MTHIGMTRAYPARKASRKKIGNDKIVFAVLVLIIAIILSISIKRNGSVKAEIMILWVFV